MSDAGRVPVINSKQDLRRHFRQLRRVQSSIFPAIHTAVEAFLDTEYRQQSSDQIIGIYWPLADEVDLRALRQQGPVALPVADGQGGLLYRHWGCSSATSQILQPDGCGIPAPAEGRALHPDQLACLLVPGTILCGPAIRCGSRSSRTLR